MKTTVLITTLLSLGAVEALAQTPAPRPPERRVVIRQPAGGAELPGGARGFLGIQIVPMTQELRQHMGAAKDRGVLVGSVSEDSPASRAGIRVGDVVTQIGESAIRSHGDVMRELAKKKDGERVAVTVVRNGAPMQLSAQVEERERHVIALNRLEAPIPPLPPGDVDELRRYFSGPEWKQRMTRLEDCRESQTKLRELEARLRELEARLK